VPVEFLEECSLLQLEVHIVGFPPAEVDLLAPLRSLTVLWRLTSWDVVDDWSHRLNRRRDLDVGVVDVDRDVGAASEAGAWIIGPVVGTTKGDGLRVIEVVHTAEERLEAVLLWIDQLLATKDLLEERVVVAVLWVNLLRNERGLQHLERGCL